MYIVSPPPPHPRKKPDHVYCLSHIPEKKTMHIFSPPPIQENTQTMYIVSPAASGKREELIVNWLFKMR
jgi:hypothetical protein